MTNSSVSTDDLALLHRLADAARAAIAPHFRSMSVHVDNKDAAGGFDPVTAADRAAERAIRAILERERPADGVLGEEYGHEPGESGRLWVLDPIDGTRAFMAGLVNWGVLIGLNIEGRAVLGALDQPYIGERFIGRTGAAPLALLARGDVETPLKTRPCPTLAEATLLTTDPALFAAGAEQAAFDRVAASTRLKRYGTDCYGYGLIALGCADLVIEAGLKPFDIQALIPIVEAAGGRIGTWSGDRPEEGGRILAAGDPRLFDAAVALLNRDL